VGARSKTDFGIGLLETHALGHSSRLKAGSQRLEGRRQVG
jgi:hypothetical protein